jgi:CRISPR-associated endonuclease/helicase Cas3
VEAGLDISAHHLWSELAPWPSIIQRLGRLNRDGLDNDASKAWFWETHLTSGKGKRKEERIGPYDASDIGSAKKLLEALIPLSGDPFGRGHREAGGGAGRNCQESTEPKFEPMPRALDVYACFSTERDVLELYPTSARLVRSTDPDADVTCVLARLKGKTSAPPRETILMDRTWTWSRRVARYPSFAYRSS